MNWKNQAALFNKVMALRKENADLKWVNNHLENLLMDIYDEIQPSPIVGTMRMVSDTHALQLEARIMSALGLKDN